MVFFKRGMNLRSPGPLPALRSTAASSPAVPLPADLRLDDGTAYLRLLSQLANCGIDAAGPPLLQPARGC